MGVKNKIKGVAKFTGKWSLKTVGKLLEETAKLGLKFTDLVITNKTGQKIITAGGIITAGVVFPYVGGGIITLMGLKYAKNRFLSKKYKHTTLHMGSVTKETQIFLNEAKDTINQSAKLTGVIANKIHPCLNTTYKEVEKQGKKYQKKIDSIFR